MQPLRVLSFLVMLCFTFVVSAPADPLDSWHFRNPLPTGNGLGSVTFGGGQFVAVGNAGTVLTSTDGLTWFPQRSAAETNLNLVGYGNGIYVAFGTNGFLQTSADGTNWTQQVCPTSVTITAVSYGNGTFVAVGGQLALTSSNGVDWVQHAVQLPGGEILSSECFGNGKFLASSYTHSAMSVDGVTWIIYSLPGFYCTITFGHNLFLLAAITGYNPVPIPRIFSSPDGVVWTDKSGPSLIPPQAPLSSIFAYDYDRNSLVLVIVTGSGTSTYGSPDGLTWTTVSPGLHARPAYIVHVTSASYGNGRYVAVQNDGVIWNSGDSSNWVYSTRGSFDSVRGVASGNGINVAVGTGILLSADGLSYNPANTPFTNSSFSDIAFAVGVFTAVGQTGLVVQSTDGISWTQRNAGSVQTLNRITADNGLLIAVGNNGRIQTSPNGRTWTARFSGTDQPLFGVAYGNGTFVTVGNSGTILTSPDAGVWTAQDSGTLISLSGVAYGPAGFVAVGKGGTIISSSDGTLWTTASQISTNDLVSVCYGGGCYLAVGGIDGDINSIFTPNPIILSSSDGIQWVRHNSGNIDAGYFGCAFVNNGFLVVGGHGTVLASDPIQTIPFSLSARQTINGLLLIVYSPPGPALRIQANNDLNATGWSDVASFTNVSGTVQWTDTSALAHRIYRAVSP